MRLLLLISSTLLSLSLWAQPRLDPNKRTVCAMTINSDEETEIFRREVSRDRANFNPVVELTTMGSGNNWFEAACRSGVRCDILLISGHFTDAFTGTHNGTRRRLSLNDMELAGCRNTCEGIMDHPYEVFLLGCNTMSTKAPDDRSPSSYLEHLLHDGISRQRAELITEARYGQTGDHNRGRLERAFRGQTKMLYGFDARGPSGATIEPMLNDYFRRRTLLQGLQRAEAVRATNQVSAMNDVLAGTLNRTAFEQCVAGPDEMIDRRICALYNEGLTVERRLSIIQDSFAEDDWIRYMPTINAFFRAHPPGEMSPAERRILAEIARNPVISRQARNLAQSHQYRAVREEWAFFVRSIGFGNTPAPASTPRRRESLIDENFLDGI